MNVTFYGVERNERTGQTIVEGNLLRQPAHLYSLGMESELLVMKCVPVLGRERKWVP